MRSPLVLLFASVVGVFAMVPVLRDVGAVDVGVGWAFSTRTAARSIALPLALWLLTAAYAAFAARRTRIPWRRAGAVAILMVASADLARAATDLRSDPELATLQAGYRAYIQLADLLMLAAFAAAGVVVARGKELLVLPLAPAALVLLARLVVAKDAVGVGAIVAGALAGAILMRGRLDLRAPPKVGAAMLVAVLLMAVGLRAAFVVVLARTHGMDYPLATDDGPSYDENAWLLVTGLGDEVPRTAFYFNAYVVFLSAVYAVFGHSFLAAGFAQAAISAAGIWCVWWVARRACGSTIALVAAAAVALNGVLIALAVGIGTEALAVPMLMASLALLALAVTPGPTAGRGAALALAGLLLGLIGVTRDVMLGLPLFLIPWLVWALWRGGRRAPVVGAFLAAFVVGAAVGYLPFSLYRDRFSFAQSYLVPVAYALGHEELDRMGIGPRQGVAASLSAIAAHPTDALGALLHESWTKFDMLFFSSAFGTFDPAFLVQRSAFASTAEVYFLMATILGLILLALRRGPQTELRILLVLLPVYGLVAHVLLFHANAATRYRAMYDPTFAIAFAAGTLMLLGWARGAVDLASAATRR